MRTSSPAVHRTYQAFGVRLRSVLDLPELARATPPRAPAQAKIAFGPVPRTLAGAVEAESFIHAAPGACLIDAPAARLLVRGGRSILIEAKGEAAPDDIRPFVIGSAFAVLCHQRGILPLHASALALTQGAVAFAGPSGSGKSTLAAQFARAGASVIADDLCAITFEDGRPMAHGGVTRLKLAADSLALIGRGSEGLEAIVQSRPRFALPVGESRNTGPWPLKAIYVLTAQGGRPEPRRLKGAEALSALIQVLHRWPTVAALGLAPTVFEGAARLAGACDVFELAGAPDPEAPETRMRGIASSV